MWRAGLCLLSLGVGLIPLTAYAQVSFSSVDGGTLAVSNNSHIVSTIPAKMTVTVPTNTSLSLLVMSPAFVSGASPDPDGTYRSATVSFVGNTIDSTDTIGVRLPAGITELTINMSVQRPTWYVPGPYQYQTSVMVVPD